jgi:hypothetical protein
MSLSVLCLTSQVLVQLKLQLLHNSFLDRRPLCEVYAAIQQQFIKNIRAVDPYLFIESGSGSNIPSAYGSGDGSESGSRVLMTKN